MSARVLVVDDDPWILRMVTASLRKRQFSVDTARDGRQALDRARANAPDIIISDVMMPVMDGWEFVQHLRKDPALAVIPVIFLTALGKDQARLKSLGLTSQDYLSKPFRFEELEKRVERALKLRAGPAPPSPGGVSSSGPHPMQGYPPHQGSTHHSGGHPQPGYPHPAPPPGPTHHSGVHPMPGPYGYHQPGYPHYTPPQGQYPSVPPGQYPPGQYPPPPGSYPPQYPGQYSGPYPSTPLPPSDPPPPTPAATTNANGRQRGATALNGKLEQLGLSSLLVMMEMERKQGVLSLIRTDSDAVGRLFLRGGRVVDAKLEDAPQLPCKECVYRMLAWTEGTFSFRATAVEVEDTIQASTTHLLMEGARLIDEAGRDQNQ